MFFASIEINDYLSFFWCMEEIDKKYVLIRNKFTEMFFTYKQ